MAIKFLSGLDLEVTSSVLKTDANGVIIAAVAGTDYAAASHTHSYLPLAGGTLSGNLELAANTLNFADNGKARFGNSTDLQIYHDGIHSYVSDVGQGNLILKGSNLNLRDANNVLYLEALQGGAVTLRHNGGVKLATSSTGVTITGGWVTDGVSVATANVEHTDNTKSVFGTGNDLEIYHDASNSYITNATGEIFIKGADDLSIQDTDGTNRAIFQANAQKLYYDGSLKFETTSTGVAITGNLDSPQISVNDYISHNGDSNTYFGFPTADTINLTTAGTERMRISNTGNVGIGVTAPAYRLEIGEDTNGTADLLKLRNSDATYAQTWDFQSDTNKDLVITGSSGAGGFKFVPGSRGATFASTITATGGTSTQWNTAYTYSQVGHLPLAGGDMTGQTTHGDSIHTYWGNSNDLDIYHDNTFGSIIRDRGAGDLAIESNQAVRFRKSSTTEVMALMVPDGAVSLYYDNSKKFETTTFGSKVTGYLQVTSGVDVIGGNIDLVDNSKIRLGTSQDLQIYHDGSNSYIQDTSGTGDLRVDTSTFRLRSANGGETMIRAFEDGAVILSHNNFDKLTTTSTGVTVTGVVTATGGTSTQWNTAYGWGNHAGLYLSLGGGTMSGDVDMGGNRITDGVFVTQSGTSDDFVKGDGTLDSTAYLALTGGTLSGALTGTSATFSGNIDVQGNSATIGSSSQTTTTLNLTATNTAGAPANAVEIVMTGYEGRGIGTFYKDTTYTGAEWFGGIIYAGSFANYAIGYDATGGQAEYSANSLLTIYKTGNVTVAGNLEVQGADVTITANVIHAGDVDTYFGFNANNSWRVVTGGSERFKVTGDVHVTGSTDFAIPAGRKLYLDGQSSTYITESSDGVIDFYGDGVQLLTAKQNGTQSEVVVNEGSGDVDFRVEANTNSHAFFVEAEGAGKVGIGLTAPLANLDISNVAGTTYQQWSYDNPGANNYNLTLSETVTAGNVRFVFDQKNAGTQYSDVLVFNQGKIGVGTDEPQSKLQVDGGIQMADDTDTASATKVGTQRYRTSGNNSYVDMCMQTGATTYEWINILENNW